MESIISGYLLKFDFGELQVFKNMGIIPLFAPVNNGPEYLTLKEALEKGLLTVKEVSDDGSVPELKIINRADIPVLLLDGEELVGAKQNRLLNASILLKKESETVIPVSCTEAGRWSFVSEEFADSDVIVSHKIRKDKVSAVSCSLKLSGIYESNQGEIWDKIDEMSNRAGVHSSTGAMKDVFEEKMNDINEYLDAFVCLPHQRGLLVFINGGVAGFDVVSLESAYEIYHQKLVKSYAMDALLEKKKRSGKNFLNSAKNFIEETAKCKEKRYRSIGHGWDYRFEHENIVGSALVYRKAAIHMAFFKIDKSDKAGRIASSRSRRGFRI